MWEAGFSFVHDNDEEPGNIVGNAFGEAEFRSGG